MIVQKDNFASLFKKFRLKSGFGTLSEFGEALAKEGLIYEESLFSHWQKGDRVPKDRHLLFTLINIFIKKRGFSTIEEVNQLLASTGQGYLTYEETLQINGFFTTQRPSESLEADGFLLEEIRNSSNILDYINKQTDLAYEKIYEGYPHMVYENLQKLLKLMYRLGLDAKKGAKHILNHIQWIRMRCLSDITKPKDFPDAYKQTLACLDFAKENNTSGIGPTYWMVAAIKRLKIVTRPKRVLLNQKEVEECWNISQLALDHTPSAHFSERLVEHLELAKIALILKDKNKFDRQIEAAFSCVSRLPAQKRYLEIMVWDVLARGNLGLEQNANLAFTNIRRAKKISNNRYQAINLFLKNTELQTLVSVKDNAYSIFAEKLREEIKLETSLLNNPYQKLRLRQKKLFGL